MTFLRSQRAWTSAAVFFRSDVAGGVVLTGAALVALVWANSPGRHVYQEVWAQSVRLGGHQLTGFTTVQEWVNGGLMSVFFLVVGLEIARERRDGDLADIRTAIVPLVGAVGGMAGAGLIYVLVVHEGPGATGWGIPMATDIAFALGALALLGRRVPPGLRLMILTLAVADDIGSVLVLALFYSSRTHWPSLVGAAALCAAMVAFRRLGRPSAWPYLVAGVALWVLLAAGGVEPALAGVVVGVLIPGASSPDGPDPAGRAENAIAPISAYVVLPFFALANAGVVIDSSILRHPGATAVFVGIVAARVVGKLGGITLACLAVVGLGWGRLPEGVRWVHVAGGAAIAGIGLTVPLLIAEKAFSGHPQLVTASTVSLLAASVVAFVVGAVILMRAHMLTPTADPDRGTAWRDRQRARGETP
ncbi:MAG TPA: Na+/H+ antiporter NhaA [Acidimicrobiales bacterium]|nr:Na+/H+ antiporter NhaA [Acidimicrobiales bacterium]